MIEQQLTDAPQPGLATGEFQVLPAAAFAHGPMSDLVGQWQGHIQPATFEGKGVIAGLEMQRAVESFSVQRLVIGSGMSKARCQQR
ncbi:hypothetical protein D9M72_608060 [compost metagenome]